MNERDDYRGAGQAPEYVSASTVRLPSRRAALLLQAIGNLLAGGAWRHLPATAIGGFLALTLGGQHPLPLVLLGMLLGLGVSLLMDEEADSSLRGPLDRVDHAALACLLAILVHGVGRMGGVV